MSIYVGIAALAAAMREAARQERSHRYLTISQDLERLRQLEAMYKQHAAAGDREGADVWLRRYLSLLNAAYERAGLPGSDSRRRVPLPPAAPCCDCPSALHGMFVGCFNPRCTCSSGSLATSYSGIIRGTLPMEWRDAAWDEALVRQWWGTNLLTLTG